METGVYGSCPIIARMEQLRTDVREPIYQRPLPAGVLSDRLQSSLEAVSPTNSIRAGTEIRRQRLLPRSQRDEWGFT